MEAASCQFKPLCTGRKRLANASGAAPLRAAPLRQCTMLSVLLRAIDETRGCLVSSIDETGPWATWPKVGRSRDTQAPTHGAATEAADELWDGGRGTEKITFFAFLRVTAVLERATSDEPWSNTACTGEVGLWLCGRCEGNREWKVCDETDDG